MRFYPIRQAWLSRVSMMNESANTADWKDSALKWAPVVLGWIVGWGWAIVAGGGGFRLILVEGPLPLTHGWYAMFSGLALCPATAWLLKRYANVEVSFLARFAVAALFIAAGRLALVIGPWPIGPHG